MEEFPLFEFESDFVQTLRCIPMSVRFKLDACGIKLTLRQWSRLSLQERHDLRLAPCRSAAEVQAYREALIDLIARRANDLAKALPEPADLAWQDRARLPDSVSAFARTVGVDTVLDLTAWANLTALQRFILIKLSRDNHDNVNFVPALREFGLLPAVQSQAISA
jgi:hypothetical protein